ncbi:serine/threonine protein kinase [Rhodococcus sp. JVH1]|uniref:serine/threonine protein kinase n=1 Tax=Rhodococcus sp. JVH1 TaxID=745408 RepID=UPI000271FD5E|nr:serine/threonine protein kinase domain protein [Rhodococcus sp. JVH1]
MGERGILRPGEVFAGYTIERVVGVGGMGTVYAAAHPRLPRRIALGCRVLAAVGAGHDPELWTRNRNVVTAAYPEVGEVHGRRSAGPQDIHRFHALLRPPWGVDDRAVHRRRWPANPPPPCGGVRVHGRRVLAADPHLTLELGRIVGFGSGLAVYLALTVTGIPAERARHETRTLTDPADRSARWSYLGVCAGADRIAVADPYLAHPDLQACTAGLCTYRTEPQYWIDTPAPVRSVTLTAGWPQIGLAPTVATLTLARRDHASTNRR